MSFLKFSLVFFFCFSLLSGKAWPTGFSSDQCIKENFETEISHEGKFFGLIKNDLKISKDQCRLTIHYKKILETEWLIDICREPIHMKVTSKGSQSVYKRQGSCIGEESSYCRYLEDLLEVLQDHGLIFAKGDREDLNSPHGQTYCSYRLLKLYLEEGKLFSKYRPNGNIFSQGPSGAVRSDSASYKKSESPKDQKEYESKASGLIGETDESPEEDQNSSQFEKNMKPMVEDDDRATDQDGDTDSGLRF